MSNAPPPITNSTPNRTPAIVPPGNGVLAVVVAAMVVAVMVGTAMAVAVIVVVVMVVVDDVAHLQLLEHSQALGVARIEEHTLPSISSNQ